MIRLVVAMSLLAVASAARAHEVRPAYLEVTETAPGRYTLLWRTPLLANIRLPIALKLPDGVRDLRDPTVAELADSLLERRTIDAGASGLAGRRIELLGLEATITDVLVRTALLDGTRATTLVRPSQPWVEIGAARGPFAVLGAYVVHGFEHILFGFDHLLFVLALALVARSRRALFVTITAFTVAHSLTLGLATLGVVHVPVPPVEAAIALSILVVAVELGRLAPGELGLTARRPWLVAFAFGLLHGFGFASALSDVGLPRGDVPLALFGFNVGVECGQLAFVVGVLVPVAMVMRLPVGARIARYARTATQYAIGALAAFWFYDRLTRF